MIFNKQIDPKSIYSKTITKRNNRMNFSITIKDALFTKINDKETLLDEEVINNMFSQIYQVTNSNATKYNPLPKKIEISHDDNIDEEQEEKPIKEDCIYSYDPQWTIDDVCIDGDVKNQILNAIAFLKYKDKLANEWGLGFCLKKGRSLVLNFFGPPGTGKSMMAEAIASYLKRKVFLINYAELESKYVGETPKNIRNAFKRAKEDNCVLIFDEADSFLGKRLTNVSQSADYGVNITRSVMLLEIERFDGIVIFTTNLLSNYDEAFKRRIYVNVEFKMPDEKIRTVLWKKYLPMKLPISNDISEQILGKKYDGISGADIRDMVLQAAINCLESGRNCLCFDDFDKGYEFIRNRYKKNEGFKIGHEIINEEEYKKETEQIKGGA